MPASRIRPKILGFLTLIFFLAAALCFGWAEIKTSQARAQLEEAARRSDGPAMLRVPEWPALDWFIAAFVLLFVAIAMGAITVLFWTISRRERIQAARES